MGPAGKVVAQMDRALKWIFPVLVLIEIGLVRTGMLSLKNAMFIVVGIEALLTLLAARQIITAFRRYRSNRAEGFEPWQAFEEGSPSSSPGRSHGSSPLGHGSRATCGSGSSAAVRSGKTSSP